MFDFKRTSRKVSSPKVSSLRSSQDDGPLKASSTTKSPHPRAMSVTHLSSSNPVRQVSTTTHASYPEVSQAMPDTLPPRLSSSASGAAVGSGLTPLQSASLSLSQASSAFSKPSPSFVAAHGEFHAPSNSTGGNGNHSCPGQMDIGDAHRGPKNPHGLSLDKSIGYFPQGSGAVPGTIDDLLRIIAAERLHQMPQKGSNWDRSIRSLECLALRVSSYAVRFASVLSNAQVTSMLIYERCYAILQLGRSQATSFVPALGTLAGVSQALSLFARCPQQKMSIKLQQCFDQVLDRTLDLLNGLTSHFQDTVAAIEVGNTPSDFQHNLSSSIEAFNFQADHVLNELWNSHIPSDTQESMVQFTQIQKLLQPQDGVVDTTQRILSAERNSRHEFTCEWFSKSFLDFVRGSDSVFWIDGRVGCGKSVLFGWILESLQSPVDGQEYTVIAYAIEPLLPSESSTACVIKALLRQIVERQYGSATIYQALVKLVSTVAACGAPSQVENALWQCLETVIGNILQPMILVIDGLSELHGGEAAAGSLFESLLNIIADNRKVRLLVLSRPFAFSPGTPLRRKTIEAQDVHKDIHRVITDMVPVQSVTPSAEIARRIARETNGDFFWSLLTFQDWAVQDFSQQMWRTLPTSLDAIVAHLASKIDLSEHTTRLILFNSIVAMRPLRLMEMEFITRLDLVNQTLGSQTLNVAELIEQAYGSVLFVRDGVVLFRHALLKQALVDTLHFGSLSPNPEMHAEMTNALLLYLKLTLGQRSELTLKTTPSSTMEDLFRQHPLLPYALRYWTGHMVASTMSTEARSFDPDSNCRLVFPDTVSAAILEGSFWIRKLSWESIQALNVAAFVRKEILGNHEATLQTTAYLAEALRNTEDYTGAAINFAIACEIAQQVLPEFHAFTTICMSRFLDVIDLADGSKVQNHASQKASVLQYMLSMNNAQRGPSSDQAMEYNYLLASHYSTMHEDVLSAAVWQNIHRMTVNRHGRDSSQAKLTAERLVTLLQESCQSKDGNQQYSDMVYEDILQTYEVTDARRIKASIAKADTYKSLEDPFNAELVYISLWHAVAEACQGRKIPENHEKLLEIGVLYARFLSDYERLSEAQMVLLGLWSQQQAFEYKTNTITALMEEVAMEMRRSDLQDIALDVLNTVVACSEVHDLNPGQFERVKQAIADITLDLVRDARKDPILSKSSEVAFLSVLQASKSQERSPADLSMVNTLVNSFANGNRFTDLITVASETLQLLWPSVMDDSYSQADHLADSTVGRFDSELANLATNLAWAYTMTNQTDAVGRTYWHLYQAAKSSGAVDDSTVIRYADLALTAFEQNGHIVRMIGLRNDMLDYCIPKYGEDNSMMVDHRYLLASLYSQVQKPEDAKEQYLKIANALKQPTFHDSAALPALRKLIDICSQEESWDEVLEAYGSLWNTMLAKGPDYGFEPISAKKLYEGYTALLKRQGSFSALHEVTDQYRSACLLMYGDQHQATTEAVQLLAESWDRRSPGCIEATHLYEGLVDAQHALLDQGETARETADVPESRLIDIYQANIQGNMEGPTITRAVRLLGSRYQSEKTRHGLTQPATLSSLAIWISMLTKQGSLDSRSVAIRELQLAINSMIGSDMPPSSLYNTAVVLATSFSTNGFLDEGLSTVQRLTEQVIFEQDEICDMDHAEKSNLVFLTAFEAHLTGSAVDFAKIHAKILMQSCLWTAFKRLCQTDPEPGVKLACGARLRKFLVEHNCPERGALIEDDLYNRFMESYGLAFTQTARPLFLLLIDELSSERLQIDIPRLACIAVNRKVGSLLDGGQVMEAFGLSTLGFDFLCFLGTFENQSDLESGFQLALMLAGAHADPILGTQMLELSRKVLQQLLGLCRSRGLNINTLDVELISRIASVLGLQESYEDLEWLLNSLWMSRNSLSLSQDAIVQLGRRLVEVRFFHSHVDSAIELGEDVLYNLQRVYGTSHPSTVDMARFLSSIYASSGDATAAMVVIGDGKPPDPKRPTAKVVPPLAADTTKSNFPHFYQRSYETVKSSSQSASQSAVPATESSKEVGRSRETVPTVRQRPVAWGFIDRGSEKGLGYAPYRVWNST